jgi:hypothetical protein
MARLAVLDIGGTLNRRRGGQTPEEQPAGDRGVGCNFKHPAASYGSCIIEYFAVH